jgi:hypothetical protein
VLCCILGLCVPLLCILVLCKMSNMQGEDILYTRGTNWHVVHTRGSVLCLSDHTTVCIVTIFFHKCSHSSRNIGYIMWALYLLVVSCLWGFSCVRKISRWNPMIYEQYLEYNSSGTSHPMQGEDILYTRGTNWHVVHTRGSVLCLWFVPHN